MASFTEAFQEVDNGGTVTTPSFKILFKLELRSVSFEELDQGAVPISLYSTLQDRGEDVSFSNLYLVVDENNVVSPYGFPIEDIESDQWLLTV